MSQATNLALIICSTRTPRIGPSIATWFHHQLTPLLTPTANTSLSSPITLTTLDLANILPTLPISLNSAIIPAKIPFPFADLTNSSPYQDPAVNTWSRTVSSFDGLIFLTPQYNWSFPASVKVAIDYLFHEWGGKGVLVVSYGGRGGGKAGGALREVLRGVRAVVIERGVELGIGGGEGMRLAQEEGRLDKGVREGWERDGKGDEVLGAVRELVALIDQRRDGGKGKM